MSAVLSTPLLHIRQMQISDLPSIIKIERLAYENPWTLGIFQDCLRVGYRSRVLELNNTVIGYGLMAMGAGEAHILNLCIHPNYQGHGHGKRLLEQLIILAGEHHIETLFLEVRTSNLVAITLYHKIGFQQVGIRKNYYTHPKNNAVHEDAWVLALGLGDVKNAKL